MKILNRKTIFVCYVRLQRMFAWKWSVIKVKKVDSLDEGHVHCRHKCDCDRILVSPTIHVILMNHPTNLNFLQQRLSLKPRKQPLVDSIEIIKNNWVYFLDDTSLHHSNPPIYLQSSIEEWKSCTLSSSRLDCLGFGWSLSFFFRRNDLNAGSKNRWHYGEHE